MKNILKGLAFGVGICVLPIIYILGQCLRNKQVQNIVARCIHMFVYELMFGNYVDDMSVLREHKKLTYYRPYSRYDSYCRSYYRNHREDVKNEGSVFRR